MDSLPIGWYPKTRNVPTSKSSADVAFEDEMATSDDDHGDVPSKQDSHLPFNMQNDDREHLQNQQVRNQFPGSTLVGLMSNQLLINARLCRSSQITPWAGVISAPLYNWPSSVD